MQLSQKRKKFSDIPSAFSKFRFKFEQFQKKKKMTLIADVFLNLRTLKMVVS